MVHNTCPYCHSDTVMVKDRKSQQWHPCTVGTTFRHGCSHWPNVGAGRRDHLQLRQRELDQQLERAENEGWPLQHEPPDDARPVQTT